MTTQPDAHDAPNRTLTVAVHGRPAPVQVRVGAGARMADLVAALDLPAATVDGTPVPPGAPLTAAGLRPGSVLGGPVVRPAPPAGAVALRWVAGPDAGGGEVLGAGVWPLGRAPSARGQADDPALAPYAALVEVVEDQVRVVALGPGAGGTPSVIGPGDLLVLGSGALLVTPAPVAEPRPVARHDPAGRLLLSRPPRPPALDPVAPPDPPAPPAPVGPPAPLPLAAVAAGATTGLVVAALTGRPVLALVGLAGSAAGLAVGLAQRCAASGRRRRAERRWQAATAGHRADLAHAALDEARRRRVAVPGLADALDRATAGSARLWERRPHHDDAYRAVVGLGHSTWHGEVLHDVPVEVVLQPGRVVGIVGPTGPGRALARSLVAQLCTWHGPADLALGVRSAHPAAWAWAHWLPHHVGGGQEPGPATLLVLDGDEVAASSGAGLDVAGVAVLAVVSRAEALPAGCDTVLRVDGTRVAVEPSGVVVRAALLASGRAEAAARALAGVADPEHRGDSSLPAQVGLLELLGGSADAASVAARWRASAGRPACPLGRTSTGVLTVDLERDGPHALVAGTTGSGKSELLRSLVLGLALSCSPDDLTFLLVDFKGGSAADDLSGLPHVVGVVSDLDGDLVERVLRSLEAEVRRRERVLRASGGRDLREHRARAHDEPLPRLVVVVDELATLVTEHPGFVAALVGVAQRGRSLGLHLVLATQRPAGALTDDVRANTALRICLRVTDRHEALDVVGDAAASSFPASVPGRAAVVRAGQAPQVAQLAAASVGAPVASHPVEVVGSGQAVVATADLVAAACGAARAVGVAAPRRPWRPALPATVPWRDLPAGACALVDDPDEQAQPPLGWERSDGHLLVCGAAGSGTSGALAAVALALAATHPPDALHLYAVERDGRLAALAGLPHTGDVLGGGDRAGQARLLRRLRERVDRAGRHEAAVVLVVDGLDDLRGGFDDVAGLPVLDDLARVLAEGPAAGVHVVASARRPGSVPAAMAGSFAQRWIARLAEPDEARAFGVPPAAVAGLPPGGIVVAGRARPGGPATPGAWCRAQVGLVDQTDIAAVAARAAPVTVPPPAVGGLPAVAGPPEAPSRRGDALVLPVGVRDHDLGQAALVLHPGDHVVVGGPPGSGRTSALGLLVGQLRAVQPRLAVAVVAGPSTGPVRAGLVVPRDGLGALAELRGPALVVVDDAERVDDPGGVLAALAAREDVRLLVAGRPDALRGVPWTQALRRRRTGLLLCPSAEDGDLLGVVLPRRRWTAWVPGRAELVQGGAVELVQLAPPPSPGRRRRAA